MPDMTLRIKQLRREKNMTQTELAAALGVQRSCVANWEAGIRMPPSGKVSQMCRLFGVSVDYICGRVSSRNTVITPPSFTMDITLLNDTGRNQLMEYYNYLLSNEKFTK